MTNRTYRYAKDEPLYPFGYGLSFADISYDGMEVVKKDTGYDIKLTVKNNSGIDAVETAEVYISNEDAVSKTGENTGDQPRYSLCGFKAVQLKAGESKEVIIGIPESAFDTVLADGRRVKLSGSYRIYAGGQQPDKRSEKLTGKTCLMREVVI